MTYGWLFLVVGGLITGFSYGFIVDCQNQYPHANCWDVNNTLGGPTPLIYFGIVFSVLGLIVLVSGPVSRKISQLTFHEKQGAGYISKYPSNPIEKRLVCKNCGQYWGPYEYCPNCGARIGELSRTC